jgi:hypothetical protein
VNKLRDNFNNPQADADKDAWIRMLISLYQFETRHMREPMPWPSEPVGVATSTIIFDQEQEEEEEDVSSTITYEGVDPPSNLFTDNAKDMTFKIPAAPSASPMNPMAAFMTASAPKNSLPTFNLPEPPASMQGRRVYTNGDSIGRGFGNFLQSRGVDVQNSGIDGAGLLVSKKIAEVSGVKNSAVIMSCGTNDVASLIGKSDKELADYARDVVARCAKLQDNGNLVYLLSINPPAVTEEEKRRGESFGRYTLGSAWWKNENNQKNWAETAMRLNKAYETAIAEANIANPGHPAIKSMDISALSDMRVADNLHYGANAYEAMLAGITTNRPIGG